MLTAKFNSIFRALALTATLALALPAFGQLARTRVQVPVAFEVGHDSMPAGEYTFERSLTGWQVYITDPSGSQRVFLAIPMGSQQSPQEGKLVLERMGSTYRLAEIHLVGAPNSVQIPATKSQIELSKAERPVRVELAMVRK